MLETMLLLGKDDIYVVQMNLAGHVGFFRVVVGGNVKNKLVC